jgi:hypothetical protein
VEAETCSDTVIITTPIKNLLVAIAGMLSERFLIARGLLLSSSRWIFYVLSPYRAVF